MGIVFLCLQSLCVMEEEDTWEMAAAWMDGDLDTTRTATILALDEEQAEERKMVHAVIWLKTSRMHWDRWT